MRRTVWLAWAVILPAQVAHAQEAVPAGALPQNVSVADRARPDYAPVGGRIGSFFLYPTATVTDLYTSNLRATETNELSDLVVVLRPAAQLESLWTRHSLRANVYYETSLHARYSDENSAQYGAFVAGRYDIDGSTSFDLNGTAARVTEPRTDINSNNASRSPIQYTNLGLTAALRRDFVRFGVVATGSVVKQTFDDGETLSGAPLPQEFRDNLSTSGSLEGRFSIGAGTSVLARASAGRISYDINPLFGLDRNSSSYRIEGGVGLALTRFLSGDLRVGYFRQANDDPRFVDGSGLSFSANLLYNPTALTSIRLTADRSSEPSGSVVTSGNVRSTGTLTVDHEVLPNLVVTGFGRYAHIEPQGPIGSADEYEARASAIYYYNRNFRFNASVQHSARKSNAFGSFDVTTGLVGVTWML
jgi:hypothetical protein